jgi:hypothetical protein
VNPFDWMMVLALIIGFVLGYTIKPVSRKKGKK